MAKIWEQYHLKPDKIEKLEGYDSLNYKLKTAAGSFVLKQYKNPQEFDLIQDEDNLMHLIASELNYKIPHSTAPIKVAKDRSFSRLLNFIDGDLFAHADHSEALLVNFGKAMAELHLALKDKKSYVIEARKHAWDLQHCLMNWPKINHIEKAGDRKYVNYFFDLFEHHVLPKQPFLRHSIIHGDLNEHNILVKNNKISGFIDFGDICYAPLIYELAIAITYIMLLDQDKAIDKAALVLKGFHGVYPLLVEEISLLYYLIPARLSVSVCQAATNISKGTDTEYILVNQKNAWSFLKKYVAINPIDMSNRFLRALDLPISKESSHKLLKKRSAMLGSNLGLSYKKPIHMTGAAFQYMYDQEGNTYLDAYNNIPLVGHCHPKISQVFSRSVRKLNTNTRYLYNELTNYAENLLSHFKAPLTKIFFVNSGSAATDLALRIAMAYTKRTHVAIVENSYHGNTQKAIEISAYKFDGKGGQGKPDSTLKLPLPNLFKGKFDSTEAYVKDAIEHFKKASEKNIKPAAFIVEPISGCGGQVPLAKDYLKHLRPYLKEQGILLISDEVQTGFGRLGKHFWGFEMHEVMPDLVVLGKPMGNAHPIGAVVCSDKLAAAFDNGMEFFSSFGGNPVSCAVGQTVLDIIKEEGLQQNAFEVGNYYKKSLKALQVQFECIADVRGEGLLIGIELRDKQGLPATKLANILVNKMKENFVLLSTDGPFNNIIKTKPPLCFSKENVDQVVFLFRKILVELS